MRPHVVVAIALIALVAFTAWRSELWNVQKPGRAPAPLTLLPDDVRESVRFDVVLPCVPTGLRRLTDRDGATLVHYWAPWEQGGRRQAALLDSLSHTEGFEHLQIVLVCFDPFPSVARFVGRARLTLPVLLDGGHALARVLPCPSIPTTYVLDSHGRIRVRQSGTVDWWAPETLETLRGVMTEPSARPTAPVVPVTPAS
ncbi:MAG TPA: TlpA disulfide reductase family protein [Dongiaceae bacterium]|nr:TlpA disulfide reductase family protein [Dongiaceae bacterium]